MKEETITMYRPVGLKELELVKKSGYKKWPPRLPEQPIFYPVTNRNYAKEITKWNCKDYGLGYVTRFKVKKEFANKYEIHQVGSTEHTEWWIPSEDLDELNTNIVGLIEVIEEIKYENNLPT